MFAMLMLLLAPPSSTVFRMKKYANTFSADNNSMSEE